jgi:chemotaxis protein CheZ
MPEGSPPVPEQDRIEAAVRAVLVSLAGDLTAKEAALLAELEALGRTIARAKAEIAQLSVDDITGAHIPGATDELDAIVDHTAQATNEILDCCEILERLQSEVPAPAAEALQGAVTRIYEACSFQDITGQRIAKVAEAMSQLEGRLARFTAAVKARDAAGIDETEADRRKRNESLLLNGPQMGGPATAQDAIDALFA